MISSQSTGANLVARQQHSGGGDRRGHVTVAVIDSGRASHPDLNDAFVFDGDFTGRAGRTCLGHSTHIAGIITDAARQLHEPSTRTRGAKASTCACSGRRLGQRLGRDRGDRLDHQEPIASTSASSISRSAYPTMSYKDDPMAQAVERAVAQGLVVVCAVNTSASPDGTPLISTIVSPGFTPAPVKAMNTHGTVGPNDGTMTSSLARTSRLVERQSTWVIKPDPSRQAMPSCRRRTISFLYKNYPASASRERSAGRRGVHDALGHESVGHASLALFAMLDAKSSDAGAGDTLQISAQSLPNTAIAQARAASTFRSR
jgi:hypothetical protein